MADTSPEHFSLFTVLRARRYVCRTLGAGTITGLELMKKTFPHAQTKGSLNAEVNGAFCALSFYGLEKVEMYQPL